MCCTPKSNSGPNGMPPPMRSPVARLVLDRRVPLALLTGLLLQAAVALWWVAKEAADVSFIERRLSAVEISQAQGQGQNAEVLVRLARIEERQQAQLGMLADIKARLNRP